MQAIFRVTSKVTVKEIYMIDTKVVDLGLPISSNFLVVLCIRRFSRLNTTDLYNLLKVLFSNA